MIATTARRVVQTDIYSRERAGIIERLTSGLHPSARWRDPREQSAVSFRTDPTPLAHTLAGACVWLRNRKTGRNDVSADLLWCFVMQEHCEAERQRVVCALVAAWLDMHTAVAKHARTPAGLASVQKAARMLVERCVTGVDSGQKIPVHWQLWRKMQESGERMLWELADTASRRASRALR
jgi:hypothetical protein